MCGTALVGQARDRAGTLPADGAGPVISQPWVGYYSPYGMVTVTLTAASSLSGGVVVPS
jgi:hypothetical protein